MTAQKKNDGYKVAATVMLLADTSEGIQTLLLRRNTQLKFAGGNWVFPGGSIDPADYDTEAPENQLLAARNAAVRETTEETGLTIQADELLHFSRWTPPPIRTPVFDTWFFLASIEESDLDGVVVDGGEIHEHRWVSTEQALSEHASGQLPMLAPTYVSLVSINRFANVTDVFAHYTGHEPFHFKPRPVGNHQSAEQIVVLYEGDAGYESADESLAGQRHRVLINNGIMEYLCDS